MLKGDSQLLIKFQLMAITSIYYLNKTLHNMGAQNINHNESVNIIQLEIIIKPLTINALAM